MNQKKTLNIISISFVLLAIIMHVILPKHHLVTVLSFFAGTMVHSYMIWGLWRTCVYAVSAMLIGFGAEFIGTHTGHIFGDYYYNPKDPGLICGVPFFIPVAYVYLVYTGNMICFAISRDLTKKSNILLLSLITACILTMKDLSTDPVKSTIDNVWVWYNGGNYFGVPTHNFVGWVMVFTTMTLVTTYLTWHVKNRCQNLVLSKDLLIFPILLYGTIILFALIEPMLMIAHGKNLEINESSAFMIICGSLPYLLLAWINGIKSNKTKA